MDDLRVPPPIGCLEGLIVVVISQAPLSFGLLGLGYLFLWLSWQIENYSWWFSFLLTLPAVLLFISVCITAIALPGPFSAGSGTMNIAYLWRKVLFIGASIPAVILTIEQIEFLFP